MAGVRLGVATTTYDAEGRVIREQRAATSAAAETMRRRANLTRSERR